MNVGQRVRFRAKELPEISDNLARSTLRPGEVWEGTITAVAGPAAAPERVTVRIETLNGMRTEGQKELAIDAVTWETIT